MKALLLSTSLFLTASAAVAEDATHATVVMPDAIAWKDLPSLPKGALFAIIAGDPSKPGLFVQRIKLPPNYQIPAHTHPVPETLVVLSGTYNVGEGDKFDKGKTQALKVGAFYAGPAKHPHYVWTSEETIFQMTAVGPFGIEYVNPAEDPRKSK